MAAAARRNIMVHGFTFVHFARPRRKIQIPAINVEDQGRGIRRIRNDLVTVLLTMAEIVFLFEQTTRFFCGGVFVRRGIREGALVEIN